jgi:hypothetical protein
VRFGLTSEPAALGERERAALLAVIDARRERDMPAELALDWQAVARVAQSGKVTALLAHRIATEPVVLQDQALAAALREALHETAVHNTLLLAELARAARTLERAGIACVALKGAVLMARHYPTPALRQAVDLDLLVDPERFDDAVAALRAAGYREAEYTQATAFDGRSFAEALDAPHFHACAPLTADSGVTLDLHRRMPTTGYAAAGGFAGLLARAEVVTLHGVALRMCAPLDLAVHLCEHYALQNHAHPGDTLRLLADLRVLFAEQPPWARMQQGGPGQRLAVALARTLYDAAFAPPGERGALTCLWQRVAVADPALAPLLAELSTLSGYVVRFTGDLVRRPGYALRKVIPTRGYMAERYAVDPRSPRLYALYGKRLLSALLAPLRA